MKDKQEIATLDDKCVLMTAVVLHYNNGNVIFETIDSVLAQDYPRIELIVSDDCSDSFDVDLISSYIEDKKRTNIERVVVRKNETNLGTVAHLERVRLESRGEIELLIAADDCWHDEGVFSAFAQAFEDIGPEAEFVTSQIEMCDETLQTVEGLFVTPSVRQMLLNGDMQSLRDLESYDCALAGPGSAFRRSFFEKIGNLSEGYTIVEDWSAHVRWLRMGKQIYYLDRVTLKHRRGGISHSVSSDWPPHYYSYRKDIEQIFSTEIEPYKEQLSPKAYEKAKQEHCLNKARCISLENRVSVLVLLDGSANDSKVIDSVLRQNNMNYEILIGCKREQAEWVINKTNSSYTQSPRIRRIRIVLDCGEDLDACRARLEKEAQSNHCLFIPPGKMLNGPATLLSFVYMEVEKKPIDGIADYLVLSGADANTTKNSKRTSAVKKRASNFVQVQKIEEDLLYIVLTLLGLFFVNTYSPGFAGALYAALWTVLGIEVILLIARVGVFCYKKTLV